MSKAEKVQLMPVNDNALKYRQVMRPVILGKTLASTAMALLLALGTVSPAWATLDNQATVTGSSPGGTDDLTDSDTESVTLESIDTSYSANKVFSNIDNSGGGTVGVAEVGDIITYTVTLVNNGNVAMTNIRVADTSLSFNGTGPRTLTVTEASESLTDDNILEIGETIVYNLTYTLTQADIDAGVAGGADSITNTATALVDAPGGNTDVAPDSGSLTETATIAIGQTGGATSSLTLVKSASSTDCTAPTAPPAGGFGAGDTIYYCFTVTNTSNVTITGIGVTEDSFDFAAPNPNDPAGSVSAISLVSGTTTLAPGAVAVFEATYVVQQADIDNQ